MYRNWSLLNTASRAHTNRHTVHEKSETEAAAAVGWEISTTLDAAGTLLNVSDCVDLVDV